jgi:adenylate cyclase
MTFGSARERLTQFFLPERGVVRPFPFAVVAAIGLLVGLALASLSIAQRVEWALYDRMMTAATRDPQPPSDIIVVAIDEPSFSELRLQWPWPRRVHAALIDALVKGGARTIVFDLVFDQASSAEDDEALTRAVRTAGAVVLGNDRVVTMDRGYELEQWVEPMPPIASAAAAVAATMVDLDPAGVVRRAATAIGGRPTLAVAAASRHPGFVAPADPDRPRLIHFLGAPRRGIVTVSYYQAIEPGLLPAGMFRDKIVLVGRSLSAAAALDEPDHFRTPVAVRMPGVEIHASQIDTLLRHRAIADPLGTYRASLMWSIAIGLFAALAFFRLAPQVGVAALAAGAAVLAAAAYGALSIGNVRAPTIGPLLAATGVFASTTTYRFALGQRERRLIRRAFQHYVAPAIVQQMLDDPSKLKLGGEECEVTVIFTDLEGFTSVSERLTPEQLRTQLSSYFQAMMDTLLAEHATLDKFIGDAIMVYFGCPVRDPAHAQQACRAALAMHRRLGELNEAWRRTGSPELRMRIGVNTGIAVAGNMGTDAIFNYTIIGDCVNLASRLEGVNKEYGTRTIVGAETWSRVHAQFEARELDWIRVKGKVEPIAIHELLGEAGGLLDVRRALRDRFGEGLALYRARQWTAAAERFRDALAIDPGDGASRVFVDRCAHYATHPPPADWDGVHVMTTK